VAKASACQEPSGPPLGKGSEPWGSCGRLQAYCTLTLNPYCCCCWCAAAVAAAWPAVLLLLLQLAVEALMVRGWRGRLLLLAGPALLLAELLLLPVPWTCLQGWKRVTETSRVSE
jgi:hypothetical protein